MSDTVTPVASSQSANGDTVTSSSAPRMRAHRARRQAGDRRYAITVRKAWLDGLETRGYLDPDQRGERGAEIDALTTFVRRTIDD